MKPAGPSLWTALVLAVVVSRSAAAQDANLLLTEGLRAYQGLDFDAAAQLLRRALDPGDSAALTPPERLRALMYLGAANLFREDRDQAVATFRTLLLTDPRYRPDSLVFPPRITQAFSEVLQTTKAVGLATAAEARFAVGDGALQMRAYATSRHNIEATVRSARGIVVATLYRGEITDSLTLSWNGRDSSGRSVAGGAYRLIVTSSVTPDQILRYVNIPLDVSVARADTLPWPTAPQAPPSRWNPAFLVPAGLLGTALTLPAALGAGGGKGIRIALGITVAAAGVFAGRPRVSTPSRRAQAEWRARLRATRQENQRRRGRLELMVRTGAPETREGPPQ